MSKLDDRDLDLQIGGRIRGACMEPSELLIHSSSAVVERRYEDVSLQKLCPAVTALAASAVSVDRNSRSLES